MTDEERPGLGVEHDVAGRNADQSLPRDHDVRLKTVVRDRVVDEIDIWVTSPSCPAQ